MSQPGNAWFDMVWYYKGVVGNARVKQHTHCASVCFCLRCVCSQRRVKSTEAGERDR